MNKRVISILSVASLLLLAVVTRLAYLQIYESPNTGSSLAIKALKFRSQAISGEEYYRGEILDRNLVSLTDSGIRPTLVAFPSVIENIKEAAEKVADITGLEAIDIETTISRGIEAQGIRTPIIIESNMSEDIINLLQDHPIVGMDILPLKTRYGPNSVAKHLIGYVNSISEKEWEKFVKAQKTVENSSLKTAYRMNDKIGVAGLEAQYEAVLRGSSPESRISGIADANGRLIQGLGYKIQKGSIDPWRNHLVLTIDRRYQEIAEKVMDKWMGRGAVVVLDIASGDVLAAASRPDFNQNRIEKYVNGRDELIDRTERIAFYPGSVFKMVTAIGVLEENLVDPEEVFHCDGSYVFPDDTQIRCLNPHGEINLIQAIEKSCNTTFVHLGLLLGNDKLVEYATKLGFTIHINSKSPPALVGNASIGQQGVLVSPLQIANLYATIARGGYYQPCRLVSEIRNYQGDTIQEFPNEPSVQVISESTISILKNALIEAVKNGSGKVAWLEEYGSAGKTGTAQANQGKKVIAWFAGFTPLENPRLAIVAMVEENERGDQEGLQGGKTAGPIFKEVAEAILKLETANRD